MTPYERLLKISQEELKRQYQEEDPAVSPSSIPRILAPLVDGATEQDIRAVTYALLSVYDFLEPN